MLWSICIIGSIGVAVVCLFWYFKHRKDALISPLYLAIGAVALSLLLLYFPNMWQNFEGASVRFFRSLIIAAYNP